MRVDHALWMKESGERALLKAQRSLDEEFWNTDDYESPFLGLAHVNARAAVATATALTRIAEVAERLAIVREQEK